MICPSYRIFIFLLKNQTRYELLFNLYFLIIFIVLLWVIICTLAICFLPLYYFFIVFIFEYEFCFFLWLVNHHSTFSTNKSICEEYNLKCNQMCTWGSKSYRSTMRFKLQGSCRTELTNMRLKWWCIMHHSLNKNGSGMYKLLHNTVVLNRDIDAFLFGCLTTYL